ncbi:DUF108 domain-containing protein [Rhizobium rhizophilum]|uniref:DUF108 domain-containing protein n=2 Tax=Rhizobium rhizophilum TaxID=1850373 RepID=A0ABY2R0M7_9HYPH|nr:DUF108 domain-containing protein [Rhizobium rhizophilum]
MMERAGTGVHRSGGVNHGRSDRLGIIGFGAIGRRLASFFATTEDGPRTLALLVRDHQRDAASALVPEAQVCTDLQHFLDVAPTVAVECASATAFGACGPHVLEAGCDLIPLSLGAFVDRATERRLLDAAARGPGRLEIAAGALGSIGFLAAAREHELDRVTITIGYPIERWRAMGADRFIDLDQVRLPTPFLESDARNVATLFPGHLNVVTGASLAGLGLDRTHVALVADPTVSQAWFQVEASSASGPVRMQIGGRDAAVDADPIDYTTFSVIRLLKRRCASLAI